MAQQKWSGKSQGSALGYKIFIKLIKVGGIKSAYFLLQLVAQYYIWFRKDVTALLSNLYVDRLHYSTAEAKRLIRKNIIYFGQSIIDKIAVLISGHEQQFQVTRPGEGAIEAMTALGKGGILVSAHLGNYEMSGALFKRYGSTYNVVMYDGEADQIKATFDAEGAQRKFNVIAIKEDMSHIYEMSAALNRNEFICMHADRFVAGNRTIKAQFLGKEALFPLGPFILASKLRAPVSFVFALKEHDTAYTFYATPPQIFEGRGMQGATAMLEAYITELEAKLKQYPEQWFNYFDFWQTADDEISTIKNADSVS